MFETVAIVGATGAVGTIICQLLEERKFPFQRIKFLASGRSAGKTIRFAGREYTVEELTPEAFDGVDLAIGSTPDEVARDFVPWAVERGCVVVDESGYWRMDPKVPLVVPEVNPDAVDQHQGIIASPNCSTTQMVVAMKPLHDAARIRRVVVSTYQATSGVGVAGSSELDAGTRAAVAGEPFEPQAFAHPIAFNLIPQIGSHKEQGYTSEEMKMVYETRKIIGDDSIQVCPTCVRVPVEQLPQREHPGRDRTEAHGRAKPASCSPPCRASSSSTTWRPRAIRCRRTCDGRDEVFIGRIREDLSSPNGLAFWCVSDNLRKGAATNAVQIAELLVRTRRKGAGQGGGGRQRLAQRGRNSTGDPADADVQADAGLRRLELRRLASPARSDDAARNARTGAGQDHRRDDARRGQRPHRRGRARLGPGRQLSQRDASRAGRAAKGAQCRVAARHGRARRPSWRPMTFTPRATRVRKRYRYVLDDGPVRDVFARRYVWQFRQRLDAEAMHRAAQALVGTHDFRSFETSGRRARVERPHDFRDHRRARRPDGAGDRLRSGSRGRWIPL